MAGYLIAEEGPLAGLTVRFEEGEEWILGRDPDEATLVLEDPMVSRRHVICRLTPEGYLLENLSSVNPATQNGRVITEAVLMREGDIIQIGSTFFRFTEKVPFEKERKPESPSFEDLEDLSKASFEIVSDARWVLKVVSGPNSGAEFGMQKSNVYLIGKDPTLCDIVFQDLSVSRQHARISIDDEAHIYVEDLGSRNGVIVNGELISAKKALVAQELVSIGTTSFIIIDREQIRETIYSPPPLLAPKAEEEPVAEGAAPAVAVKKDWKDLVISTRHLIMAGTLAFFLLLAIACLFSLFKTETIELPVVNESEEIQKALKGFDDIQFSYNQDTQTLFLVGHVLTGVDKQELLYILKSISYINDIDDNVVIDEYVWQNMNALLITNPDWQNVSIHSPKPGRFVMRGYLQNIEQAQALSDYINMNFPYLDRLENQVVVENNLVTQIQSMLVEKGFSGVTFQLANGELVLAGRADQKRADAFNDLVSNFKSLAGVRLVKNFVVLSTAETSRIDISTQYQVMGTSKRDDNNLFVMINGRILSKGDILDGMMITSILPNMVLLEKDGLKFKINYNLQ